MTQRSEIWPDLGSRSRRDGECLALSASSTCHHHCHHHCHNYCSFIIIIIIMACEIVADIGSRALAAERDGGVASVAAAVSAIKGSPTHSFTTSIRLKCCQQGGQCQISWLQKCHTTSFRSIFHLFHSCSYRNAIRIYSLSQRTQIFIDVRSWLSWP